MIHKSAIIDPSAELGCDVEVGPFAIIEGSVRIGDRCRIESHAIIKSYTVMGDDNHIHHHALLGGIPQDLKYAGEESYLHIGSNNQIREFATLHRGTEGGGGKTVIGDNNLLMAYTHVAHDCILGNGVIMSNVATLAGHVKVGDHAIIGGVSAVHQFCRIGEHAFVGGMSGIGQDVPPWMLASGGRATIHGPNTVGLRRYGASQELLRAFKNIYRLLWLSETPKEEALQQISEEYAHFPEALAFVDFVRHAQRGICAAGR